MARPITIGDCSILPRRGGGASKEAIEGGFVLKGTDIEVRSSSVSSEWTTESSDEADSSDEDTKKKKQANKAVKRKVRTWRIKCKVDERRDDRNLPSSDSESDSSSGGSSSSTSTGSSTSGEGEVSKQKRQRRQLMREWEARKSQGTLDMKAPAAGGYPAQGFSSPQAQPPQAPPPELFQVPPPPGSPPVVQPLESSLDNGDGVVERPAPSVRCGPTEWFNSKKRHRCFCIAPGFLSVEEINQIHSAAHHPSVKEINDRKGYLAFKHRVWRFEAPLRALYPELYNRLIAEMIKADGEKWKRVRKNSKRGSVYPEIEYITYDVAEMGQPCFIEPHVDNKSAVTMVAMLSDKRDYVGGKSCFRRAHGRRGHRQYELEQGDLVMFRGEKLSHWITPVVAGRRVILQIELSRV